MAASMFLTTKLTKRACDTKAGKGQYTSSLQAFAPFRTRSHLDALTDRTNSFLIRFMLIDQAHTAVSFK